ncbi:MAG: hypothetical protein JO057_19050 [Chloroflexi bacterium]|nr:hypothetical protein [Chloroflexota bacterium]
MNDFMLDQSWIIVPSSPAGLEPGIERRAWHGPTQYGGFSYINAWIG